MSKIKTFSEEAIYLYSCLNKIDIQKAETLFKDLVLYYNGKKSERLKNNPLLHLESQWYASLNSGVVDYSVYADEYYFIDLMACYWIYSKNYISGLNKNIFENKTKTIVERFNIDSIIDLGCGLGYTTIDLKKLFPRSDIFATNIKDTPQWYHCLEVLDGEAKLIDENTFDPQHIDLVFASEFFEHIHEPIAYLENILHSYTPDVLIIANSFNTKSIGHFYEYNVNGNSINQKDVSRMFNSFLRNSGYKKEKTHLWNDKPSIWIKNEP
jgi:SAM-dependent methyltransferase